MAFVRLCDKVLRMELHTLVLQDVALASGLRPLTPSTPAVPNCCRLTGSAPYWSNPLFLIVDTRALWRSVLSARAPECQKLK